VPYPRPPVTTARDRILQGAYDCVARYGMGKTTVEDAAREAGVSRATVYRQFPGGKDELLREVVAWETARFFGRLADEVQDAPTFAAMLERGLLFAHRSIGEHAVLQKVLAAEPDRLLPALTVQAGRLLHLIQGFLGPYLAEETLRPGVDVADAAEYLARLVLTYIGSPGQWDMTDPEQVAALVHTEFLAGIIEP
jgi:AcrR family transcriptional regulator